MNRPLVEILLGIEAQAHPVHHPAAASGPLAGGGLGDGLHPQLLHLVAGGIALDPGQARIHHVADARHGEGGLRHIGGQHHPPAFGRGEYPALFGGRLAGEEGQDLGLGGVVGLAQGLRRLPDLPLAGEKHQHVAGAGAVGFVHGVHQGFVQIPLRRLAVIPANAGIYSRFLDPRLRGGDGFDGAIPHLDGIQPPRHLDHRRRPPRPVGEVVGEALGVQGGGGHDELHVRPLLQ